MHSPGALAVNCHKINGMSVKFCNGPLIYKTYMARLTAVSTPVLGTLCVDKLISTSNKPIF